MSRREMEEKILVALREKMDKMSAWDAHLKEEYDDYMRQAEEQENDYWKKDLQRQARRAISLQNHGYEFLAGWKNIISKVMFDRIYRAYVTTELSDEEIVVIDKVFDGLVRLGFLRLSKSGKMATFKG